MPEPGEIEILHQRYQQQAGWTASIRGYLLPQTNLPEYPRILEVGCGTGVILNEVTTLIPEGHYFGIDFDWNAIAYARRFSPRHQYMQSNALRLPFSSSMFDLAFCHFFLLWAKPLDDILSEIFRVLKPGAAFIAFAEPDYGGRIDYPSELEQLGVWQEQSLQSQGAHTRIGRALAHHLTKTGFRNIQTGIMGGEWSTKPSTNEEHETLLRDLDSFPNVKGEELKHLLEIDQTARENGTRILFVPTFYGLGWK